MNVLLKLGFNILLFNSIFVNLSFVPSPPLNLRLHSMLMKTERRKHFLSAEIAWNPPQNSHGVIAGYRVNHQLIGPPNYIASFREYKLPISTYSRNVTSTLFTSVFTDYIGFGDVYEFSVAAINSNGIGLEEKLNVTTRACLPHYHPISVYMNGSTSQSIYISWKLPHEEDQYNIITEYQVLFYIRGMENSTTQTRNTNNNYIYIQGLEKDKHYTFGVTGITENIPVPWCPDVHYREVVLLPDPPINIEAKRINERQIKLTWELSPNSNITVVGFKIYYCVYGITKDIESCDTLDVGPITMMILGKIDLNSDYQVAIKSKGTDNRYGTLSNISVSNMSNVPNITDSSVKELKCDGKVSSIEIKWSKPDIEKDLQKFLIIINGSSSFTNETGGIQKSVQFVKIKEVEYRDSVTKYVIDMKDMEPNTVYDISVKSIYKSDITTHNNRTFQITSCRTLMTSPKTVFSPEVLLIHKRSLSILFRFRRVTEKLGVIRRYYLFIQESTMAENTSNSKHSLDNLQSSEKLETGGAKLVAEFKTDIFMKSSNISLWMGHYVWLKHTEKSVHFVDYLLLSPIDLCKKKGYKALLRACVYQDYIVPTQTNFTQCTDSDWSTAFNFTKTPEKKNRSNSNKQGYVFTVSIIALISIWSAI